MTPTRLPAAPGADRLAVHESIDEIPVAKWNALNREKDPFLRHEFLAALEHCDCVGPRYGWLPRHLSAWQGDRLIGAVPLYQKDNSYGEFVFDFAWADAYQRHGVPYFPKLVAAVPYTPATGHRLLVAEGADRRAVSRDLVGLARGLADESGCSSLHWLFVTEAENARLGELDLLERVGCQFHWHNRDYADFEDFLSRLTSKRRKNIRRERRLVDRAGIRIEVLHGAEVSDAQWRSFAGFYAKTFEERYSLATLNEGFFREVGERLGDQVILILAYDGPECVAGALLYRSPETLYGRHWGCARDYDGLHFEVCFYQGIEYCIREGLRRFEPGAQGEHKIWRGFLPTLTWSRHWIAHPGFRTAIDDFLRRETPAILDYAHTVGQSSPYRNETHTS